MRNLKTRYFVRGNTQVSGLDYFDTYAPVVQQLIIWVILFLLQLIDPRENRNVIPMHFPRSNKEIWGIVHQVISWIWHQLRCIVCGLSGLCAIIHGSVFKRVVLNDIYESTSMWNGYL